MTASISPRFVRLLVAYGIIFAVFVLAVMGIAANNDIGFNVQAWGWGLVILHAIGFLYIKKALAALCIDVLNFFGVRPGVDLAYLISATFDRFCLGLALVVTAIVFPDLASCKNPFVTLILFSMLGASLGCCDLARKHLYEQQ